MTVCSNTALLRFYHPTNNPDSKNSISIKHRYDACIWDWYFINIDPIIFALKGTVSVYLIPKRMLMRPGRIIFEIWLYNRQIPQCNGQIAHGAPFCNRNMHISVTKWCTVGCETSALWDLTIKSIGSRYITKKYRVIRNRVIIEMLSTHQCTLTLIQFATKSYTYIYCTIGICSAVVQSTSYLYYTYSFSRMTRKLILGYT